MRIRKIVCIQMGGEFPDFCYRLVMPDYGMPLIGTILAEAGYEVVVFMEHVQAPVWDIVRDADLVCFSSLNAGAGKTYALADRVRTELDVPTIIGGTHATYYPESCLDHVDYVVLGEGDETVLDLVDALERAGDVREVPGIAFRDGDEVVRTAKRPGPQSFETIPKFELIHGYPNMNFWDVLRRRKKPLMTAQSSRGCPFKCTFCIVNTMFETGYRKREIESVIEDLRDKRRYGRELIFVDNDFAQMRSRTKALLRRMVEEEFGFQMTIFTRVESTRDDELLELMARAGVVRVYQGYESVHPDTLKEYSKRQTLEQIVRAIEKLHAYDFHILGSFVLGADTDTPATIEATVEFVLQQKLSMGYFFPVWGHFPEQINGYNTIVPWYRSIFRGWEYCDGNFVNHFPLNMPPSRLQELLIDAHLTVYSGRQIVGALRERGPAAARHKLLHRYSWNFMERHHREHIGWLQELEQGLYDARGRLREERLVERVREDPRWTFQAGNRAIGTLGLSPLELPIPQERNITCVPPLPDGRPAPQTIPLVAS